MLRSIYHILTVLFLSGYSFYTIGQSTPQKPRWNRRTPYQLTVKQLSVEFQTWTDQSGLTVTKFQKTGPDSIVLSRQDQIIGTFLASGTRIYSPRFVMKDGNGTTLWIDSFRVKEQFHLQTYLANYRASLASHWTFYSTGILSGVNYKDLYDEDSLSLQWSESGILRLKKQKNREYHYSETGFLQSVSSTNGAEYKAVYYNNGIIQRLSCDTIIKNQIVQYIADYSVKGVLLKESWLKGGEPCETWREYDQTGKLIKTVRHTPLVEFSSVIDYVAVPLEAPPVFLTYVEELADYPGGQAVLFRKLETDFIRVFYTGRTPLEGPYTIRFEVNEDGMIKFLDITGLHAENIQSSVKTIMEKLPRWQPGKSNGKRVKQITLLTLDFKAVKH
ncbi:hypothetical protein [Fluviicola sp.]|uniref:hypothetical protein n=1 Tax=Fluviicola sp. TaxID=1917219 RepID=UPI00260F3210|nr:hypothetical protein [Fluviicola sp.]